MAAAAAAAAAGAMGLTERSLLQGDNNAFEFFFAAALSGVFIRRARSAAAAES